MNNLKALKTILKSCSGDIPERMLALRLQLLKLNELPSSSFKTAAGFKKHLRHKKELDQEIRLLECLRVCP